jgi:DNA-binding Lrp family transcriptional regulator
MDALDVKILRALASESSVAPSNEQLTSSLRSIAARLGADDVTVSNRYKKLRESGAMTGWRLVINPTFFGCKLLEATVDVQPESAKPDMIRKLKLVNEILEIHDFYGRGLRATVIYSSAEARSRVIELISRITNAESITQVRWFLPQARTERLTATDVAIVRALSNDARMTLVRAARILGLSTRTVRNHVEKLRRENTIYALPNLNMGGIPGLIPVTLSYSYSKSESKGMVDRAMLAHFEASYLSVMFSDPDRGYIWLSAPTMTDVQDSLGWAKSQPGVASARTDILTRTLMFPEKLIELLKIRNESEVPRGKTEKQPIGAKTA